MQNSTSSDHACHSPLNQPPNSEKNRDFLGLFGSGTDLRENISMVEGPMGISHFKCGYKLNNHISNLNHLKQFFHTCRSCRNYRARENYKSVAQVCYLLTAVDTWVWSPVGPSLASPKSESFGLKFSSKSTFEDLKSRYITCPISKMKIGSTKHQEESWLQTSKTLKHEANKERVSLTIYLGPTFRFS